MMNSSVARIGSRTILAWWVALVIIAAFLTGFVVAPLLAQDMPTRTDGDAVATPAGSPPAISRRTGVLQEVEPETVYVRDEDGQLVPVLVDMTYEEFTELYELRRNLERPDQQPRFVIDDVTMETVVQPPPPTPAGAVAAPTPGDNWSLATARWKVTIDLHVLDDGVVRIPLGFPELHLTDPPDIDHPRAGANDVDEPDASPGDRSDLENADRASDGSSQFEHLLEHVTGETGYVLWVRAEAGSRYRVELSFVSAVIATADGPQLRFSAPAATTSELRLTVPGPGKVAKTQGTATLVAEESHEEQTTFRFVGLRSETQIGWGDPESQATGMENVFEVRGDMLVEVRGPGSLLVDARLNFATYGQPLKEVRVQLPPGARLISPLLTEAYEITWASGNADASNGASSGPEPDGASEAAGPVAIVTFAAPDQVPASELRLLYDQNWDVNQPTAEIELGDFQVLGALRHYGTVTVMTSDGDWRVNWGELKGLTRLWEVPERHRDQSVVGSFAYFRQPFSLPIRVAIKATRITADPLLIFRIGLNEVELQAEFRTRISGAPASVLRVDMPSWQLTGFSESSSAIVDTQALEAATVTPLEIPLTRPRTGILNLGLQAIKSTDMASQRATLELPQLLDANSSAPLIIIVPDEDIALNSPVNLADRITAENVPPGIEGVSDNERAVCFRYRGTTEDGPLVYELRPKQQTVRVASEHAIVWEAGGTLVCDQILHFDVRHAPLRDIVLRLPEGQHLTGPPSVTLDQEALAIVNEGGEDSPKSDIDSSDSNFNFQNADDNGADSDVEDGDARTANNPDTSLVTYRLSHPRQGTFAIHVRYTVPVRVPAAATATSLAIPLVRAQTGVLDEMRFRIMTPLSISLQPQGEKYRVVAQSQTDDQRPQNVLELYSASPLEFLTLNAIRTDVKQRFETAVDGAVLQTWATHSDRRDRCVFRLASNADSISLEMPENALLDNLQVVVDGRTVIYERPSSREIAVPIWDTGPTRHTIELVYPVRGSARYLGDVVVPKINGTNWVGHFYWHLVLPSVSHLVDGPDLLQAEDRWQRHGVYWARTSRYAQPQWERWLAATTRPSPPAAANEYFFSGFGPISSFRAVTGRRSWFIMAAAIAVGLAVYGIPRLSHRRRGTAIVLVCLSCLTLGLWQPVAALILLQAAVTVLLVLVLWQCAVWMILRLGSYWDRFQGFRYEPPFQVRREEVARSGSSRISPGSTSPMPPVTYTQSDSHS